MLADDSLLFIDTNKYLDLYRTEKGKKILPLLKEQEKYIFVTQQVVNEVQRNKITVAAEFLKKQFPKLELQGFYLPDHLSNTTNQREEIREQMKKIDKDIKKVNAEVNAWQLSIIKQISRSEDEVSKALSSIFANPVCHTAEELQKARERRELGNPPGKSAGSIGDQLNWEQILTNFKGKRRLWIISRDSDYGIIHDNQVFLNRFLYEELCNIVSAPEVYLFTDLPTGIKDFVDKTGVKAKQSLDPKEAEEIEREEKSLPPLAIREAMQVETIDKYILENNILAASALVNHDPLRDLVNQLIKERNEFFAQAQSASSTFSNNTKGSQPSQRSQRSQRSQPSQPSQPSQRST
jgi:hypothetical protein